MSKQESLTVIDNRTGKKYTLPIDHKFIDGKVLREMGLKAYDPSYGNTGSCTSKVTFIDGAKGILRHRGIPIEQLCEKSSFLETAYLCLYGELPTKTQLDYFQNRVMSHTMVHEDLKTMMKSFRYDAHPMGMMMSAIAALGTFHPEANPALAGQSVYNNKLMRNKQIYRLIGVMPTIAAFAYRHRIGRPYVDPDTTGRLSYEENYLYMLDNLGDSNYTPHPVLAKAFNTLFILHADHEQNCSASAMRHLASAKSDVYSCLSAAIGALYGPLHGGANEAVLRMLEEIGTVDKIPEFLERVKARKAKLMGFGHRVYKNYDPRARLVKGIAAEVFKITGKEPLIEIAVELERVALSDPYFIKRKLFPNVDFYSGCIYKAMGFPTDYFPVLFAIPRTVGWLAQWNEFLDDKEAKIVRPFQKYIGYDERQYQDLASRPGASADIDCYQGTTSIRRNISIASKM